MEIILLALLGFGAASIWITWFWSFVVFFVAALALNGRGRWRTGLFWALFLSWLSGCAALVYLARALSDLDRGPEPGFFALQEIGKVLGALVAFEFWLIGSVYESIAPEGFPPFVEAWSFLANSLFADGVAWAWQRVSYVAVGHATSVAVGAVVGTVAASLYAPSYRDGSEYTGAREWRWFRERRIWRLVHWWFDLELVLDWLDSAKLPKSGGIMLACWPHGLLNFAGVFGVAFHGGRFGEPFEGRDLPKFPDGRLGSRRPYACVSNKVFWIPVLRELALWAGCVDVGRETLERFLDAGATVGLIPDGVQGMIGQSESELHLHLGHAGFARVAADKGVTLVPVFFVGENRVFLTLSKFPSVQRFFVGLAGYAFPAFYLGPFREPLKMVVGEPMDASDTSKEEVARKSFAELLRMIRKHDSYPMARETEERLKELAGADV